MIDVSVVICTRDRATRLDAMLASLTVAIAAARDAAVEVILVDNGSSDATPVRLATWCAAQPFATVRVVAPQRGLARARNAGLRHARGRIVAMTDDDCVLHADYLVALTRAFAAQPGPAIIGGRILPGDPGDLPVTVKLEDHPMVAECGRFPGGFVMGANLAFTADVPARIGDFDERLGAGAVFRAAEDTDFLFRAQRAGIAVLYDPTFVVDHHHGRRCTREVARLMAGYAIGDGAVYAKHCGSDRRILSSFAADLWDLRRDLGIGVRGDTPVPWFYSFRLRFKIVGFCTYALAAMRRRRLRVAATGTSGA